MCATMKTFSFTYQYICVCELNIQERSPTHFSKVGNLPRISTMQLYIMIRRVHPCLDYTLMDYTLMDYTLMDYL